MRLPGAGEASRMVAHLAIQDSHRSVSYLSLWRFFCKNREAETSVRLCVARRWVDFDSRRATFFFGFQRSIVSSQLSCAFSKGWAGGWDLIVFYLDKEDITLYFHRLTYFPLREEVRRLRRIVKTQFTL